MPNLNPKSSRILPAWPATPTAEKQRCRAGKTSRNSVAISHTLACQPCATSMSRRIKIAASSTTVFRVHARCKRLFRCGNSCGSGVDLPCRIFDCQSALSSDHVRGERRFYWEDERALRRFGRARCAGGSNIAKRGGRCVRSRNGAITNSLKGTTATREGVGRQLKMPGLLPRIARPTVS